MSWNSFNIHRYSVEWRPLCLSFACPIEIWAQALNCSVTSFIMVICSLIWYIWKKSMVLSSWFLTWQQDQVGYVPTTRRRPPTCCKWVEYCWHAQVGFCDDSYSWERGPLGHVDYEPEYSSPNVSMVLIITYRAQRFWFTSFSITL